MLGDLELFKATQGITSDDQDDALMAYLKQADAAVKAYCDRIFESATYTEYPESYSGFSLYPREWPVGTITGVDGNSVELGAWYDPMGAFGAANGAFASTTKLVHGTDYVMVPTTNGSGELRWLGRGNIGLLCQGGWFGFEDDWHRRPPGWPGGVGAIKLVYTAGYTACAVPDDLRAAVMSMASLLHNTSQTGGLLVGYEKLGEYAVSLLKGGEGAVSADLISVRSLLSRYRRFVVA